jgi:hypothetical protein
MNPCTCAHDPDAHFETIGGCRAIGCACAASARAARAAGASWADLRPAPGPEAPPAAPPLTPRGYELLAQLALAATPAPWEAQGSQVASRDPAAIARQHEHDVAFAAHLSRLGDKTPVEVKHYYDGAALVGESMSGADAAFIAAANPRQVLDLLGELAEAQEDARAARAEVRRTIETLMQPGWSAPAHATALEATMLARDDADAKLTAHLEDCPRCTDVGCAFEPCEESRRLEEALGAAQRAHDAARAASRAAYRARSASK